MLPGSPRRFFAVLLAVALAGACGKPNADAHLKKGNAYFEDSKFPEAIVEYRLALQADPARADVRQKLAGAYLRTRDGSNALKEYVRAADLLPKDPKAQLEAGSILLQARAFEEAKARANKVLALDPKSADGQILLGNSLAGLKDLDGAVTEYQEAIALNPSQDNAYINMGAIQLVRGERDEAEASFKKAIDVAPKSVRARMAWANFLWASGRAPEAEQILKDALALEPANLAANRALGTFYLSSNRASEAEPYFQTIAKTANTTAASFALADYYVVARRSDDARKVLVELAKKEDGYAAASTRLAALDTVEGQRTAALSRLHEVLTKYPKDIPARLLNARVLVADGKPDEALANATTLIANEPSPAAAGEAYLLIGGIHAGRDRLDDAIEAYEQVLKRQPKPFAAALALGSLQLRRGQLDKAATYAKQASTIDPKNPQARVLTVRILLARQDVTKAKEELAALQTDFPKSPTVLDLIGQQQLASHQTDAARASFVKAAELNPGDLEALTGLVTIDLSASRAKEAVGRLEDGLKKIKPTASLLMLAAQTYDAAGNPDKAEEMLKRAIETEPSRLQAYNMLGGLYIRRHQIEDAKAQFQKIAEQYPKSTPAKTMIGILLEVQRRLPEAEQQYQKVLAIDSHAAVAANNLAWLYVAGNRNLDEALRLAQAAKEQLPDEPHVNDTLGWIYYRKNMPAAAVRYLESSVQKDPSDPTTHYHLGMAYVQVGENEKAKKSLQRALAFKTEFEGSADARKALSGIGG